MEPAFHRGDILFLTNPSNTRYEIGDITVYKIPGQDIPIVHRILETHDVVKVVNGSVFTRITMDVSDLTIPSLFSVRESKPRPENQLLLTKGDNNYLDDVELYQGLDWLERKHIVGKVRGWVSQVMTMHHSILIHSFHRFLPYVGYVTIAMVCCSVSFQRKSHKLVLAE